MISRLTFEFMQNFFPDTALFLAAQLGVQLILCHNSEISMNITNTFSLRNPTLLPIQLLGLLIGSYGALKIKKSISGSYAFLFFALMNLSSIICHNISQKYSTVWEISRIFDIIFTGSSSLSLPFITKNQMSHFLHFLIFLLLSIFGILSDYSKNGDFKVSTLVFVNI